MTDAPKKRPGFTKTGGPPAYSRKDFSHSPLVVFYELTRACDLVCQHCRACAQPAADPNELTTDQSKRLIDQLAEFQKPPLLVMTGGDPLKRHDVYELIRYATGQGLAVAITPSATPLVTGEALDRLREAGIARLAISLDGADAASHDALRGVAGSYDRTLEILEGARRRQIPTQINTTLTRSNIGQIDQMAELAAARGIILWSVFFLIPVGRGTVLERLSADECEQAFESLWHHSQRQPYAIKTTEAPHYRRYVLQQKPNRPSRGSSDPYGNLSARRAPLGINDGKGVMFISHTGLIHPSGFLPISCGQFPGDNLVQAYQSDPTFVSLRDANQLTGKCGACDFRQICGGSRARTFALTGDVLAAEPDCAYVPSDFQQE